MSGMRMVPPRLPSAPSIFTPSPAMRATRSSTKRAPPCVCSSHATAPAITRRRTAKSATTRRMSERDAHGKGEPDLARRLGVREVDGEGACGRPEAHAHAIALVGLHVLGAVLGVAHVDERGAAPALVQPVHVLDRAGREVAAAHDRVAFLDAEALVGVAAIR